MGLVGSCVPPPGKGLLKKRFFRRTRSGMIIGVTGPLPSLKQSSELSPADLRAIRIATVLASGVDPLKLARRLAGKDEVAGRKWRMRIKRAANNPHAQAILANSAQAEMWLNLLPITDAVIQRARRGRPDAIRMVWQATGFYNEKVSHEHSGDIAVTVKIARPDRVEDRTHRMDLEEGIIDADVVEETD